MARYIKGVVVKQRNGIVRIKLKNSRCFWTKPKTKLGMRQYVWVAWDYTHNRPKQVLTQEQYNALPTEVGLEEPELGAFSTPDDEGNGASEPLDADVFIPSDDGFVDILDFEDLETEPGAFSNPLSDGE